MKKSIRKKHYINKYNGGIGATLCNKCHIIICAGIKKIEYCNDCMSKAKPTLVNKKSDN